jgi:exosortase/archaeosortase family protein
VAGFILIAIIFALKKPELKDNIAIAVLGSAALLLINLLRVYLVLLAAISFGVQWAEAMHFFSWFVMAALVIGIWYYSVTRVYKKKNLDGFL